MAMGGMSFRYFILGLLVKRSMSGYDVRRLLRSLDWLLGSPSFGTIYPALHGLLEDEWVSVEVVPHPTRPPRKIYTITEAGTRALAEWAVGPSPSSAGLRGFIMRLILEGDSASDGLAAHLRQRQEAVAAHRSALEQVTEDLGEGASLGELVAIEYGLAIASAEMAWLAGKLDHLTETRADLSKQAT